MGRVGRAHGIHGAFYVDEPEELPVAGAVVRVAGTDRAIVRRGGVATRPLVVLEGIAVREAAAALRGQALTVSVVDAPLEADEWLTDDLVGCRIEGLGQVSRVIRAPSCDLLEAGPDAVLVPLIRDAVRQVDIAARRIEVDRRFLGLEETPGAGDVAGAGEAASPPRS